jgi:hypothetical protein
MINDSCVSFAAQEGRKPDTSQIVVQKQRRQRQRREFMMRFLNGSGMKVCISERYFEELEQRIVLDATVDHAVDGHAPDYADILHQFSQALTETAAPDREHVTASEAWHDPDFNVVLISDRLTDVDMLKQAASQNATVIVYDGAKDNLDTVNVMLQHAVESSGKKIDHLAVLDHAKAGQVWIGADKIDLFGAQARRGAFESLGQKLSDGAQIQLYGCSIAGDPMGQALVDRIALYTQADVFAALHKIGASHTAQASHHEPNPVTSIVHEPPAVEPPIQTDHVVEGPIVEPVVQPAIITHAGSKVLILKDSFRISDTDQQEDLLVSVTYNPDADSGAGITALKMKAADDSGAKLKPPAADSNTWTIQGPVGAVNSVLKTMIAAVDANYEGNAQIAVTVADPDPSVPSATATLTVPFSAKSSTVEQSSSATDTGVPVNQIASSAQKTVRAAPEVPDAFKNASFDGPPLATTGDGTFTVEGGQSVLIPSVQVYDPGSFHVETLLRVTRGSLSVPNPLPGPGVEVRGNNGIDEPTLQLAGPFQEVNRTLSMVTYKPFMNYMGPDELTIQVNSRGEYARTNPQGANVTTTVPIAVVNL